MVTEADKLLREWLEWFERHDPIYMAPLGMTKRYLATVHDEEE